jgi:hypothetical protein
VGRSAVADLGGRALCGRASGLGARSRRGRARGLSPLSSIVKSQPTEVSAVTFVSPL